MCGRAKGRGKGRVDVRTRRGANERGKIRESGREQQQWVPANISNT